MHSLLSLIIQSNNSDKNAPIFFFSTSNEFLPLYYITMSVFSKKNGNFPSVLFLNCPFNEDLVSQKGNRRCAYRGIAIDEYESLFMKWIERDHSQDKKCCLLRILLLKNLQTPEFKRREIQITAAVFLWQFLWDYSFKMNVF